MYLRLITVLTAVWLLFTGTASAKPYLLVVIAEQNELAIFDGKTYELIGTAKTGEGPHEVVASPDGRYAYVTDFEGADNTVSVIDLAAQKRVKAISMKPVWKPHGIAITSDGKFLYVTCEASRAVAEVDLAAGKVSRTFPTKEKLTHMLALSPDETMVFASNSYGGLVSIFDTESGDLLRNTIVGDGCEGLAATPDGRELWVANRLNATLSIIDLDTRKLLRHIDCPGFPMRVKFTPDGKRALVTNATMGHVTVLDAENHMIIEDVRTGQAPIGLVIEPRGKHAYVGNLKENTISVIDLESLEVTRTIETPGQPDGLGWAE